MESSHTPRGARVLRSLRHMAEHGGDWYGDAGSGVWRMDLGYARSVSEDDPGFTQDDIREFLKSFGGAP